MIKRILLLITFFLFISVKAQEGFLMDSNKNKVVIPFKLINNLIFISLELNDVPMTFLVDSGVEETILFGLEENKEVELFNTEKVRLKGLGGNDFIEAIKSTGNKVRISRNLIDAEHTVLIILDEEINFSPLIGISVNGIIGYSFFQNYLIGINYERSKITLYKRTSKNLKLLEKYNPIPISIEAKKPYLNGEISTIKQKSIVKLLVDTGNSDAIWLFENQKGSPEIPENNFDDFLGVGFSGEIYGKRAKIKSLSLLDYTFENPYVTFPDSVSLKNIKMVKDRAGSVGGEILRRFHCVFDYKDKILYMKKNSNYKAPFLFNKSGLEIHHSGTQWVQETMVLKNSFVRAGDESHYAKEESSFKYKFDLKPTFVIVSVREGSPSALAGLKKDDKVISINKKYTRNMTLQQINNLLKDEEDKKIDIQIDRKGKMMNFTFSLKSIL